MYKMNDIVVFVVNLELKLVQLIEIEFKNSFWKVKFLKCLQSKGPSTNCQYNENE